MDRHMAPFSENDGDRLDWDLLQNSAVTLYWRRELFERDVVWLKDHGYEVYLIDCSGIEEFRAQITRVLRFQENYGYEPWTGNLDALNDAFRDLGFDGATGIAFCLVRIDLLAASDRYAAQALLDIIESHSRDYLLLGLRLLALAQSDDPKIQFDPIGARTAQWNREEWLNASRGV
jgi:hypothetical protein